MIGRLAAAMAVLACGSAVAPAAEPAIPHHAIEVRIDAAAGRLDAVDQIALGERSAPEFFLASWLSVGSVTVAGRAVPVQRHGDRYRLEIPTAATDLLRVAYGGNLGVAAGEARMDPEAVYLPAGSGWFPATGDARVTYRLRLEAVLPFGAVATGNLLEETTRPGVYRATFESAHPGEEPSIFAGLYRVDERRRNGILLRTYFEADARHLAGDYLDAAGHFLDRYHLQIGPYPFANFHMVSSPLPVGLGFPGVAYVSRKVLPLPFMRGRSLAHEVLHNWWGNGVEVDPAGGNWAEGLTTYQADHALAAEADREQARAMRVGWLRDYAALPPERDFALRAFVQKRHGASQVVGYNKAAFVFHMLENEIGPPAFAAALRQFFAGYRFRRAGWDALRRAFEEACGRDLGWFFDQWLERPGAPSLALERASTSTDGDSYAVLLAIGQQGENYRLRLPVTIETESGPVHERIAIDAMRTEATFRVTSRPLAVAVDPDFEIFRRLDPEDAPPILRHVTLAPETAVVIAAADDGSAAAARQIAERLLDAPPRMPGAGASPLAHPPLLVIGIDADVGKALAEAGLGQPPAAVDGPATARVWAGRTTSGRLFAVVSATDTGALQAIAGPLPHYGSMSHLVFEGSRVVVKGVSPVSETRLRRSFPP